MGADLLEVKDAYVAQFGRAPKKAPLEALRRRAIERFGELGFPTGREEAWRFTDVTPIAETVFGSPNGADHSRVAEFAHGHLKGSQLTFVDGRFAPELSSIPRGLTAGSLAESTPATLGRIARFDDHAFAALNTALFSDGAYVNVPRAAEPAEPVHLLFLATGEPVAFHPRVLVVAEPRSRVTIVESHIGPTGGAYFANAVTELSLGEGASIDYVRVQRESPKAYHVASIQAFQDRYSTLISHTVSLGAAIARHDIGTVLDGEGAEVTLNGLYEASAGQVVDHHTSIEHAKPHGTSRELYKGILSGQARGVFDGRILVRPDAQKTNAVQSNKNLLLSKQAIVNTKPQLEIQANDVKCKHGATIGQLDRDVLFYLRSRGLDAEEARRLLIHAFASEILDEIKVEAIRHQLGGCLFLMAGAPA